MRTLERTVDRFPPWFDLEQYRYYVTHPLMKENAARPKIAILHPVFFALTYLRQHLEDEQGRFTLNDMHIDMAEAALEWRFRMRPGEYRHAWIAPRNSGKSTWMFLVLPLWAAAADLRKFTAMFADSTDQAQIHLNTLREELRSNEMLRHDFPDLCLPSETTQVDNASMFVSRGGHIFAANGIDARRLGLKVGRRRPDMLVLDDIEPHGSVYGEDSKKKRLATVVNAVFPMADDAVVCISGTVTMYGSIVHDLVRSHLGIGDPAPWIKEHNFTTHYYPAIITEDNGTERSIWPTKWSWEELNDMRTTETFQLNFMNNPESSGSSWKLHHLVPLPGGMRPDEAVLSIDPANKSKKGANGSDDTGLSVVRAIEGQTGKAYVEEARGVRLDPADLRAEIRKILWAKPYINTIILETNSAGDHLLSLVPKDGEDGVRVITYDANEAKNTRIKQLFRRYQDGEVFQAPGQGQLVDQQLAYPDVRRDDVLDSVAAGVRFILTGSPK